MTAFSLLCVHGPKGKWEGIRKVKLNVALIFQQPMVNGEAGHWKNAPFHVEEGSELKHAPVTIRLLGQVA